MLHDATYHLAFRILQLAADLGLDKSSSWADFPSRTARNGAYLQVLQHNLAHLCHRSGFFRGWCEDQVVRRLVQLGIMDDNDGLWAWANSCSTCAHIIVL